MDQFLFLSGLSAAILVLIIFVYGTFVARRRRRALLANIVDQIFPGAAVRYLYHSSRKKGAFDPAGITCQVTGEDIAFSIARRSSWDPSTTIFKETRIPVAVMIFPVTASDFTSYKRVAGFMGLSVFPEFTSKFGALARSHQELDTLKNLPSWSDFVSEFESDTQLIAVYFLGSSDGPFSSLLTTCGETGILVARRGEMKPSDQGIVENYCKLLKSLAVEFDSK